MLAQQRRGSKRLERRDVAGARQDDIRFVALVAIPTNDAGGHELHSLLVSTDGSSWSRSVLPAAGFEVELGTVVDGALWLIGQAWQEDRWVRQVWATDSN